jgi:hypothetical protein
MHCLRIYHTTNNVQMMDKYQDDATSNRINTDDQSKDEIVIGQQTQNIRYVKKNNGFLLSEPRTIIGQ